MRAGFVDTLRLDVRASLGSDEARAPLRTLARALFTVRLQSVILLRLGQAVRHRLGPAALVIKYTMTVLTGADIALQASIGPGLKLFHPVGVVIGPGCVVGRRCTIMQGVTLGAGPGGSPVVGDDVFIGPGAKIFGKVMIGSRSVIGANAVVLESIPDNSFAAGIPAAVIKRVEHPHQLSDDRGD